MTAAVSAATWSADQRRFVCHCGDVVVSLEPADSQATGAPTYRPDLAADMPGISPYVLWEWTRYKLLVTPLVEGLTIWYGDQRADALGQGVYLLQYQNSLGASTIRFSGGQIPDLAVEVVSRKMGSPGQLSSYPTLYRQLVSDITNAMLTLPFDVTGATTHAVSRAASPAGPSFALHFLRRHGQAVAAALHTVGREPFRILEQEEELRPAGLARRLTAGALRWGMTHPAEWIEPAEPSIAWIDRRYLPGRLPQQRGTETFDTPENRFVKHFLTSLLRAAADALQYLAALRIDNPEIHAALQTIRDELRLASGWPWLQEVGAMTYLPVASQVLHRKDGYRELMQFYPEFLLASTPFGQSLERAIAARNVADLYEYWCFLRLVKILGDTLGPPVLHLEPDEIGGLRHGLEATFQGAPHRLIYNKAFRGGRGSYSVGMRPDYTLLGADGKPEVAFDAKFRLDAPTPDFDDPAYVALSPQATDLYKMHTYRDGLGLRAAIAIYPGDQAVFYDQRVRRRRQDVTVADVVQNADLHGVGAIPFRPGGEAS